MSNFKDSIFIMDLHNTLYDEVSEYGEAMIGTINFFLETAKNQNVAINEENLYHQIAQAHKQAESDWDNDIWFDIDELKSLDRSNEIIDKAVSLRCDLSQQLTKRYAYKSSLETLNFIKEKGARVVVATEATANAAADSISWLGLDGVVDRLYSWPYHKPFRRLEKTYQSFFPQHPDRNNLYLQKPHPLIIGAILLDLAKGNQTVPEHITTQDVYIFEKDDDIDLSILAANIKKNTSTEQAFEAIRSIKTKLKLRDTMHKAVLADIWSRTYYVGDSLFKDGFLARNSNVKFIQAGYGKNVRNISDFEKAKNVLYKVTGWDSFLLQLTQQALKLPAIKDKVEPYFICERSLKELIVYETK